LVTTRTFTKAEHADSHCQMGNFQLALDEILQWLNRGGLPKIIF